jgi:hypothetical protein
MRASSGGRRVAWAGRSASQVVSGGVVTRSSGISHNSDNRVIRPQPAHTPIAFPLLSGYFDAEFFMGK